MVTHPITILATGLIGTITPEYQLTKSVQNRCVDCRTLGNAARGQVQQKAHLGASHQHEVDGQIVSMPTLTGFLSD